MITEKRNIKELIEKEAPNLNNLLDPEDVKQFKVLTKISNAEENLKTLSKHFDESVDDDDIPF